MYIHICTCMICIQVVGEPLSTLRGLILGPQGSRVKLSFERREATGEIHQVLHWKMSSVFDSPKMTHLWYWLFAKNLVWTALEVNSLQTAHELDGIWMAVHWWTLQYWNGHCGIVWLLTAPAPSRVLAKACKIDHGRGWSKYEFSLLTFFQISSLSALLFAAQPNIWMAWVLLAAWRMMSTKPDCNCDRPLPIARRTGYCSTREIMLFIGKPKRRSMMISNVL